MPNLVKKPDSWIEQAPVRIEVSREVSATPDAVWKHVADHESWSEWFDAVKSVEVTGAAEGVGGKRRVSLPGLVFDEEFVAWEPGERFAFTVVAVSRGLFRSLNERVTIDDLGDGRSRVTYTQAFAPSWWFRVPMLGLKGSFRRNLAKALDALSARIE